MGKNLKHDEKGRQNQETWWKIEKQQSKMMKNKGKSNETFKKTDETMKNDEK